MSQPLLLVVRLDIAPEVEEEFNTWYNTVHVPAILSVPGILSGRRFISVEGAPRYMAMYEVESQAVLTREGFANKRGMGRFSSYISGRTYNVYHEIFSSPCRRTG